MPTKTDRILGYLPGTFRALPKPTALFSFADAFGSELQSAENSLAALMAAHWVDHADRNADEIDDLARMAALYGLAPRPDESVEEFREHLKRYIRTFLEGTVTVQGILRVTADALGVRILDAYEQMDTWWTREGEEHLTVRPDRRSAAGLLFGAPSLEAVGGASRPATFVGSVDLSAGVDLRETPTLQIALDGGAAVEIDLVAGTSTPEAVRLVEILAAIQGALGADVASTDGPYLHITSPTTGGASRLDIAGNAAPAVLGLTPSVYAGRDAAAASVTGHRDGSSGFDLAGERFLRLQFDQGPIHEIDCAGPDPANTTLGQVVAAINDAVGAAVATHDGTFLALTSTTTGVTSVIAFHAPATQNATARLFGAVDTVYVGRNAAPARLVGTTDLRDGIDLSEASYLRFRLDDDAAIEGTVAGADPARTRLEEVVAAINTLAGTAVATHNGRFLSITSPTTGASSRLEIETPAPGDASPALFGITPRFHTGEDPTPASVKGTADLSDGVNAWAQYTLAIGIDGAAPVSLDLRRGVADPSRVTLDELVGRLNEAAGYAVATHDGAHLQLTSARAGEQSRIDVLALESIRRRPFVSRAFLSDEATFAILGYLDREAVGTPGRRATIAGKADLRRGVDLRDARFIRLRVDAFPPFDVDCARARPRATTLPEIVDAINTVWQGATGQSTTLASTDGQHLLVESPTIAAASLVAFETPQATDALPTVLGVAPGTYRGEASGRISYVSTVTLNAGVVLPADARIVLGVDGGAPVEIRFDDIRQGDIDAISLSRLVLHLNQALGVNVAAHDGIRLILTTLKRGAEAQLVFEASGGIDVTPALFGFEAPRVYRGPAPGAGRIEGARDLGVGVDLSTRRILRLAVDGAPAMDIDCAAGAADPAAVTPAELAAAINAATALPIAAINGGKLILTSPTTGLSSRLTIETVYTADARAKLFGNAPVQANGEDAQPARLVGEVDLSRPVDLSQRDLVRVAIDGGRPLDIPVAGLAPDETDGTEIVAALNAAWPGLASLTAENRLVLTSPSFGASSRIAVAPIREIEVVEYAPVAASHEVPNAHHGDHVAVENNGAADSEAAYVFYAPDGVFGPGWIDIEGGTQLRARVVLRAGERLHVGSKQGRLNAAIEGRDGHQTAVDPSSLFAGPIGVSTPIPFEGPWALAGTTTEPPAIHLYPPMAPRGVTLRARTKTGARPRVHVSVRPSERIEHIPITPGENRRLTGRLACEDGAYRLLDGDAHVLAELRFTRDLQAAAFAGQVVQAKGRLFDAAPPVLLTGDIEPLFDVRITSSESGTTDEVYEAVTIGGDAGAAESIEVRVNAGTTRSAIVKASSFDKIDVLRVARGRNKRVVMMCRAARFNEASFNRARFAGGLCQEAGIFNASRFTNAPPETIAAVFGDHTRGVSGSLDIVASWTTHRPGAFAVNLPLDLPERFGGRFNTSRFGLSAGAPELFEDVVSEPADDPRHFTTLMDAAGSAFVTAETVPTVPLGWSAVQIPFRKPRYLSQGTAGQAARLYLFEDDVPGFIKIEAKEPGAQGNSIFMTARTSGPAQFDIAVQFDGGRFENARAVALGDSVPTLGASLMQPARVGVLQAKAAGVSVAVTRE